MDEAKRIDRNGEHSPDAVIHAYEKTADLLAFSGLGVPMHELLMLAFLRGHSSHLEDSRARYGERVVA